MSIFQADLIFYTAINAALADMRRNTFLMDDAYSNLRTDPLLRKAYGEKEVERFKAFLAKEIAIFTQFRPPDQIKFPCIVIKLGGGEEDAGKDALGDSYGSENVNPATLGGAFNESNVVMGPLTPKLFDPLTGTMTFGSGINLITSNIFDTQFVYDSVNEKSYPITLVLDSSNLLIELPAGAKPNFTNMMITRQKESYGSIRRSIWVYETHSLELMATDATELLYLYTTMMYILGRYKKHLWQERNFTIATISYSPLYRVDTQDDPNNVYAREISIRGRVEQNWIESTRPLISGVNTELLIADMKSPEAILPIVENQGWRGEFDE